MSFGKNMARFRKEKGWTQEDLSKKSSVGVSQIRRYETDKSSPGLSVVIQLAKTMEVSIDDLIFANATSASKPRDRELFEQIEIISTLDEYEKLAVKKILEAVIVKHQVEKMMKPKNEKSWSQRFREITDRLAKGTKDHSQEEIDDVIDEAVTAVRAKDYAHA